MIFLYTYYLTYWYLGVLLHKIIHNIFAPFRAPLHQSTLSEIGKLSPTHVIDFLLTLAFHCNINRKIFLFNLALDYIETEVINNTRYLRK